MASQSALFLPLLLLLHPVASLDNGLALTPPMGWRHWKAFYAHIDQSIMEAMMDEMVQRHTVDGVSTSLSELGYVYVGLDDHWQNCTRVCANGTVIPSWHRKGDGYEDCVPDNRGSFVAPWYEPDGTPRIDTHRFPNLKGMVARAHMLGLRAGWYMGNYQCVDALAKEPYSNGSHWNWDQLAEGSVKAIADYGFDSVKLDSGFVLTQNLTLWAQLLNATGRPVMIENCHQGGSAPGLIADAALNHNCTGLTPISDCPFHFWRTTGDPEPDWRTIMRELNSLRKVQNEAYPSAKRKGAPEFNADPPRSRPGGWAYPGTMVVGDGQLTAEENRAHFGAWCITSSPLILAFNLSCAQRRSLVWDIITNKEAISVNQAWDGHPGSQVLFGLGSNGQIEVWTKPLGQLRTAVLLLNAADKDATPGRLVDVSVNLTQLNLGISGRVKVRDVWQKMDLPCVTASLVSKLPHHGSAFYILMQEGSSWPPPFRRAPWLDPPGLAQPVMEQTWM